MEIYQHLLSASAKSGFEQETWEIGAAAIREWTTRNNPESFAMPATSGYQWKHLFLPNGTLLRTVFNGKNFHCLVEEDHIRYCGKEMSPSGFANGSGAMPGRSSGFSFRIARCGSWPQHFAPKKHEDQGLEVQIVRMGLRFRYANGRTGVRARVQ